MLETSLNYYCYILEKNHRPHNIKKNFHHSLLNLRIFFYLLTSTLAVKNIISKFDLELFDIQKLSTHGGSLRYFIKRKKNQKIKISKRVNFQLKIEKKNGLDKFLTFKKFGIKTNLSKLKLISLLNKLKKNKKNSWLWSYS